MVSSDFENILIDENSDPDLKMLNQSKLRLKKSFLFLQFNIRSHHKNFENLVKSFGSSKFWV